MRAQHELIKAHADLPARIVRHRLGPRGVRVTDEHLAAANLALVRAAAKFDPARGVQFNTYATYWIDAALYALHAEAAAGGLHAFNTREERRYLWGREDHGLSPERVQQLEKIKFGRSHARLDAPEALERPAPGVSPDVLLDAVREAHRLKERVARVLRQLPLRERCIIEERVMGDEPPTLLELGERMGVSRERVRQLEARALERLKELLQDDEEEEEG